MLTTELSCVQPRQHSNLSGISKKSQCCSSCACPCRLIGGEWLVPRAPASLPSRILPSLSTDSCTESSIALQLPNTHRQKHQNVLQNVRSLPPGLPPSGWPVAARRVPVNARGVFSMCICCAECGWSFSALESRAPRLGDMTPCLVGLQDFFPRSCAARSARASLLKTVYRR
jgi:hypothetical protein